MKKIEKEEVSNVQHALKARITFCRKKCLTMIPRGKCFTCAL